MSKEKSLIKMTRKDAIAEHKKLTKVLRTGKGLKSEYNKQEKELKKYEHA